MSIPAIFLDRLRSEFTCYYEVSELPEIWDEWLASDLPEEAAESATRLSRSLDKTQTSQLAAYLRSASRERTGALILEIEKWTRFLWRHEDEDWLALQQILNVIADKLDESSIEGATGDPR